MCIIFIKTLFAGDELQQRHKISWVLTQNAFLSVHAIKVAVVFKTRNYKI